MAKPQSSAKSNNIRVLTATIMADLSAYLAAGSLGDGAAGSLVGRTPGLRAANRLRPSPPERTGGTSPTPPSYECTTSLGRGTVGAARTTGDRQRPVTAASTEIARPRALVAGKSALPPSASPRASVYLRGRHDGGATSGEGVAHLAGGGSDLGQSVEAASTIRCNGNRFGVAGGSPSLTGPFA